LVHVCLPPTSQTRNLLSPSGVFSQYKPVQYKPMVSTAAGL